MSEFHSVNETQRQLAILCSSEKLGTSLEALIISAHHHIDRIAELEIESKKNNTLLKNWAEKHNKEIYTFINRIYELRKKSSYFIAEFEENWKEGRLSIDCKNACDLLKGEINEDENQTISTHHQSG